MRGDAAGPLAQVGSAREDFIIGGRRDDVADNGNKTTAADGDIRPLPWPTSLMSSAAATRSCWLS